MITLPTEKVKAESKSPRKMLIYSSPKVGKTTAGAMLDGNLTLDFEDGATFVDSMKINIPDMATLGEVLQAINEAGKPYKYGTVDTTTKLEDMVLPLAKKLYRATSMGKNFDFDKDGKDLNSQSVLNLPNGAGYLYLREAYTKVISQIDAMFPRVIYFGHLKDKMLEKNGKEVSARDIDLTGKIRNIACANADAIGFMYRKDNQTIVSFQTKEDIICGARPEHLRNKEIVLLEEIDGKIISHWDRIYID